MPIQSESPSGIARHEWRDAGANWISASSFSALCAYTSRRCVHSVGELRDGMLGGPGGIIKGYFFC